MMRDVVHSARQAPELGSAPPAPEPALDSEAPRSQGRGVLALKDVQRCEEPIPKLLLRLGRRDNDPELFPGRIPLNPPPIDVDDEQYAVEAILDHRKIGRSRQFLVHWDGYSDIEDSWVKERDIDREMVRAYFEMLGNESGDSKAHKVGTQITTITKRYGRETRHGANPGAHTGASRAHM